MTKHWTEEQRSAAEPLAREKVFYRGPDSDPDRAMLNWLDIEGGRLATKSGPATQEHRSFAGRMRQAVAAISGRADKARLSYNLAADQPERATAVAEIASVAVELEQENSPVAPRLTIILFERIDQWEAEGRITRNEVTAAMSAQPAQPGPAGATAPSV
jgi:hypothetical protein